MNDRITQEVHRRTKGSASLLRFLMAFLAVAFLLLGILFSRGFMLPCFLMAGLYFVFDYYSVRDYEYILDGRRLTIIVIRGRQSRKIAHVLELDELEVVAPHDSPAVASYRKGAPEGRLPKFDYTSYEDGIPYYTMIIRENSRKIKLLLDLDQPMLRRLGQLCPGKVHA